MDQKNHNGQTTANNQGQSTQQQKAGMSFVLKKGEKLITALYMVTDIMSEREPMKWKMRESGVELLSDIAVSFGASSSERMTVLRNAIKKIEKIVSFLEIAEAAHMISAMNASVLKKEYINLKSAVEGEWNDIYQKSRSVFNASFFDVPHESIPELPKGHAKENYMDENKESAKIEPVTENKIAPTPIPQVSKTNFQTSVLAAASALPLNTKNLNLKDTLTLLSQKDNAPEELQTSKGDVPRVQPQVRPAYVQQEREVAKPIAAAPALRPQEMHRTVRVVSDASASHARTDGDRTDRRSIILTLIKQKPSLNVKDIVKSIPGVSEKTLQRELLAMVADGILVKRGERRWSTYSLR